MSFDQGWMWHSRAVGVPAIFWQCSRTCGDLDHVRICRVEKVTGGGGRGKGMMVDFT